RARLGFVEGKSAGGETLIYTPALLKLDRQHFSKTAGGECRMMAELHAGDGAAGLSAVEGRRLTEAVRAGERARLGEAAARRDGKGGSSLPVFVVRKPIARHMGTRDRRDQQLRVRVLGSLYHQLHLACLGDVSAVEHEDCVAHLIGGGKIVGYV